MTNQPSDAVSSLLRTALQTYQRGEHATARAIVRRLSIHHPDDPRVWMTLARIAGTRQEQRDALEQVLVFDPHNQAALRGLARFNELSTQSVSAPPPRTRPVAKPALPPAVAAAERTAPEEVDEAEAVAAEESEIHWPLYAVVGVAVLVVLVAYLLLRPSNDAASGQPTPPLPGAVIGTATVEGMPTPPLSSGVGGASAPTSSAAGPPAPTLPAVLATTPMTQTIPFASSVVTNTGNLTSVITAEAPASLATTAVPTVTEPPLGPTVAAQLPLGQLVTVGPWTASLLSPDHAKMLDGSIGSLQPQGRFVLALMSVANSDTAPQTIPESLVTLVDGQGRHYQPVPAASAAYLQAYGQAQAGDFSMEQPLPGGNRTWSVPIIFDVPSSVQSLTLQIGGTSSGWPVEVAAPPAPTSAAG